MRDDAGGGGGPRGLSGAAARGVRACSGLARGHAPSWRTFLGGARWCGGTGAERTSPWARLPPRCAPARRRHHTRGPPTPPLTTRPDAPARVWARGHAGPCPWHRPLAERLLHATSATRYQCYIRACVSFCCRGPAVSCKTRLRNRVRVAIRTGWRVAGRCCALPRGVSTTFSPDNVIKGPGSGGSRGGASGGQGGRGAET